ncbi:phosphoketolase family protein [Gloeomargarita sp.]
MTVSPAFCQGIDYFGGPWRLWSEYAHAAAVNPQTGRIEDPHDPKAVYQTLLAADALRYLVVQMTASKASGHPGGFASCAEAMAALVMLGYKNIPTEVGHHAPGFYSLLFLDGSLEKMGITTVAQMRERFRELHGLLGHLSGAIPGVLSPAGPLGQGQHFAMAAAYLYPGVLFPVTIGDGGLGEPYVLSSFHHFHTAFPQVTNFLPVLVWNGYSQEHHSMVATLDNAQMERLWRAHGFTEVIVVDAKAFDDQGQSGDYVDSTLFSLEQRLKFTEAVLAGLDRAAKSALGGNLTVFILKQLKGAGVHARGAKSHNLYAQHTLDHPDIVQALQQRALPAEAWVLVRENFQRAGGGAAAQVAVTESVRALPPLPQFTPQVFPVGDKQVATTAVGHLVVQLGQSDPKFLVTNADGNEASGMANVNQGLRIIHPTADTLYNQSPQGQVYEPLSEDACAGLAAAVCLLGGRSLWCSYESFAINGLPIWQTVTQAMAELRRPTPSTIALFTAGALEQGRNGWTHQRPEIEAYYMALMHNGNVYPLFPPDANCAQAAYLWAVQTFNKGIAIFASKTPLPVRTTWEQAQAGVEQGAIVLQETPGERLVVLAVVGDMILLPVFAAAAQLQAQGIGTRIVSMVNLRRLCRAQDVAWASCAEPDGQFMDDETFARLFHGDALLGITGGPVSTLEPLMVRSQVARREMLGWQRGETTATPGVLMEYNGLSGERIAQRALALLG